jgi:hypothetical protein
MVADVASELADIRRDGGTGVQRIRDQLDIRGQIDLFGLSVESAHCRVATVNRA